MIGRPVVDRWICFVVTNPILKSVAVRKPRKACEKAEKFCPGKFFHSFFTVKAHILVMELHKDVG